MEIPPPSLEGISKWMFENKALCIETMGKLDHLLHFSLLSTEKLMALKN